MGFNWGEIFKIIVAFFIVGGVVGLVYLISLIITRLAKARFILTMVDELTAQAVERNGKFTRMLLTAREWDYRGNKEWTEEEEKIPLEERDFIMPDEWDVIPSPSGSRGFLGGLHFLGWPGIDYPREYEFNWTSKEKVPESQGQIGYVYKTQKKKIDYILVRKDDVYFIQIDNAETSESMPLIIRLAVTAQTVNPYKALYGTVHWEETVENQLAPIIIGYTRGKSWDELRQVAKTELSDEFLQHLDNVRKNALHYGVLIKKIQVETIDPDPTSDRGQKYRELTTLVYEAEQHARAREIEAGAEHTYLEQTVGYIGSDAGRRDAFKWQQLGGKDGKLTTLVEGGDVKPSIPIGNTP